MLRTIPPIPPTPLMPPPPRAPRWRNAGVRLALALAWLLLVVVATRAGLDVRERVWEGTAPIRFRADVTNAMRIGHGVNDDAVALARARDPASVTRAPGRLPFAPWGDVWAAYRTQYDDAYGGAARPRDAGPPSDRSYWFDYPPGRLWVVTAWLRVVRADPEIDPRENLALRAYADAAIAPMRRVNVWHEWLGAAGTFALARRVLRGAGRSNLRAGALATVAAMLAWFNPALILNAHGWPQWDAWVLPYAIWAVYCGVAGRWLMAGALLAVGAMFKGQVMLIVPLLAMWPLFRGDLDAVARLAAGFVFAAAACLSPWLIRTTPAVAWIVGVIVFAVTLAITSSRVRMPRKAFTVAQAFLPVFGRSPKVFVRAYTPDTGGNACATEEWAARRVASPTAIAFVALACAAIGWIVAPFAVPGAPIGVGTMLLLAALAVGLPGVWRGRGAAVALATIGLAAFAAGARFDGSFAWLPVGFQTDRYPRMSLGKVINVPAILGRIFGWSVDSPVPLPGGGSVEMRALLRAVAMTGVALAALAMARATRPGRGRLDANLLVALPAAWLVLYATLPQMHERYLLWATVTSALLATRSIAGLLAHLLLTAAQVTMLLYAMIESKRLSQHPTWEAWYYAARGLEPTAGYAIALMACVLVAWALTREGGATREPGAPRERSPV